ncbi:MAG: peptidylprolyl isomerase, partial [Oscillospiraceae bacterium]
ETPSIAREVLGVEPETTILTVGATNVTAEEYALTVVQFVLDEENAQLSRTGLGLDWNASYEVGDLNDYFKQLATNAVVGNLFYAAKCKELGCKPEELAGKFSTKAGLDAFIKDNDLLRAKHILIPSVDLNSGTPLPKEEADKALTLAKTVLAMVQADPSEGNFDKLMKEFSKDGGMAQNPNGYVFTKDDMVPPFEKGTRALEIGKISGLVESDFGYHIILRLDPALDQNVISGYQRKTLNDGLAAWIKTNEVHSTPLYDSLDAQTLYTKALPILQAAGT